MTGYMTPMRGPSVRRQRSELIERISVLLPVDRGQQLRLLAVRRGKKVSPLVKEMIIKELDLYFGPTGERLWDRTVDGVDEEGPRDQPAVPTEVDS